VRVAKKTEDKYLKGGLNIRNDLINVQFF